MLHLDNDFKNHFKLEHIDVDWFDLYVEQMFTERQSSHNNHVK